MGEHNSYFQSWNSHFGIGCGYDNVPPKKQIKKKEYPTVWLTLNMVERKY